MGKKREKKEKIEIKKGEKEKNWYIEISLK